MRETRWVPLRKMSRPAGPVWLVVRKNGTHMQKGYFKINSKRSQNRQLLVNELITYRLAKRLHLNIPTVQYIKVQGRSGILSIAHTASRLYNWNQYTNFVRNQPVSQLHNPNLLLKTFVFDIWVCNIDRHGGNLMVYKSGTKYDFYMIDHGLTLLGALKNRRRYWNSPYWDNFNKYNNHLLKGLRSYINSYEQLSPHVHEIQQLSSQQIKLILNKIPPSLLSKQNRIVVGKLLLHRQNKLDVILKRWLTLKKKPITSSSPIDTNLHVHQSFLADQDAFSSSQVAGE